MEVKKLAKKKKVDKTIIYYVLGGAALGAIAGYVAKKVGVKNILDALKAKKIIPENILNIISDFTGNVSREDFDVIEDIDDENLD